MSQYDKINIKTLKSFVPSWYTEQEKEKIVLLLIDLANIYLDIQKRIR